jgi:serine/threonine protein kinase
MSAIAREKVHLSGKDLVVLMKSVTNTQDLQQLGSFKLANLLGSNGTLSTFKGFNQHTDLASAVVVIPKSKVSSSQCWEQFTSEFNPLVLAGASRVARPQECGQEQGHFWAAYEWSKGTHLGNRVRDDGLPHPAQVFEWMGEVASAIGTLHQGSVIHRILNPSSIFINDFQQAVVLHAAWGRMVLGSEGGLVNPDFMSILPFVAPEIAAGEVGDEASDVYSIGSNLFFLLTGHPVFWNDDPHQLAEVIRTRRADLSILEFLPQEACELVEEMLSFDPEDRPINLPALADRMMSVHSLIEVMEQSVEDAEKIDGGPKQLSIKDHQDAMLQGGGHGLPPSISHSQEEVLYSEEPQDQEPQGQGQEGIDASEFGMQSSISDAVRYQQDVLAQQGELTENEEQLDAEAALSEAEEKKKKRLILSAIGFVVLLLVAATAVGVLLLPGDEPPPPSSKPVVKPPSALELYQQYDAARDTLYRLGTWNKAYQRKNGRWALNLQELEVLGAGKKDFADPWGAEIEVRASFVLSAGIDATWDNEDDVWYDAETGTNSQYSPPRP